MRVRRNAKMAAAAMAAVALAACGTSAAGGGDGETYKLRFAHYFGPTNAQSKGIIAWADEINERTDGRVEIEFFYGESLVKAADMLGGVASGRADLGYAASLYFPAELPLASVVEIPFTTSDPGAQATAFYELYQDNEAFRSDYENQNVHVLTFNPIGAAIVGAKEPISGLDWFAGKQIRSVGLIAEALESVDAVPVGLTFAEIYESMQRGVVDAYTNANFDAIVDIRAHEVGPYIYDTGLGTYVAPATVINLNTWNSLPEDIQEIITEVSAGHVDDAMPILESVEDETCATVSEGGGTAGVLPEDDVDMWREQFSGQALEEWKKRAAQSHDEETVAEFHDQYLAALEEAESASDYETGISRCLASQS